MVMQIGGQSNLSILLSCVQLSKNGNDRIGDYSFTTVVSSGQIIPSGLTKPSPMVVFLRAANPV
jgi:hypothetical protein